MGTGVLLTGYGGPDSLEAVGPFMTNLMGVEPSEELLERVRRRYLAIGGSSPLTAIAVQIAEAIEEELTELGTPMPVVVGMAYWYPFIVDGLAQLKELGCDRVITVSLSAFETKIAHGKYREAIDSAVAQIGGIEVVEAPLVSEFEGYVDFFAGATAVGLSDVEPNEGMVLVFSAHSLPETDLIEDDPYVAGLKRTANAVATKLGLSEGADSTPELLGGIEAFGSFGPPRPWCFAYQSKGNRPCSWLGPDLDDVIEALGDSAASGVVVVPIGFMTDHMETLYDLDIVAADKAYASDLEYVRIPVPNNHPMVVKPIAAAVSELASR